MTLAIGEHLRDGRYHLLDLIGRGATGAVYLAEDTHIGREVAIKVLNQRLDDELVHRFQLEARSIAHLSHPNIVELYDFSRPDEEHTYLIMKYIPGRSLYHICRERGPMSEATALCVAHELTLALDYAHSQGVIHRDIKPENILLHDGRMVLTDFGGVKVTEINTRLGVANASPNTIALGTPGFMAPEQFMGKKIGPQTDIFAVGATLYNLVTHTLAFKGETPSEVYESIRKGKLKDPSYYQPMLSAEFCDVVMQCLDYRISKRVSSVRSLRKKVLKLLEPYDVPEIRAELLDYQKHAGRLSSKQIQRHVDWLIQDLKLAIAERRIDHANARLRRLQLIAPVDERLRDISGVARDRDRRLYMDRSRLIRSQGWFWIGVSVGILLGSVVIGLVATLTLS